MIIVKLMGGLGNQMFQYSIGRYLSLKHCVALKLDLSFLLDRTPRENFVYRDYDLDVFNLKVDIASKEEIELIIKKASSQDSTNIFQRFLGQHSNYQFIREPFGQYIFDKEVLKAPKNTYLEGYWQNINYFKAIESTIRKDFEFEDNLSNECLDLLKLINNTNSICLNVRRADYVTIKIANQFHGVCDVDYFNKAVDVIKQSIPDPHFFVFSDDIEWCKKNINISFLTCIVTHKYAGRKFSSYLRLMSNCKHFIIPNSTFAWWGAWLNPNPDKIVIAPKQWFRDETIDTSEITPPEWIRI